MDYMSTCQENSITFTGKRYTAELPWKLDSPPLPTNYDIVKRRTGNLLNKLRQDPVTLNHYNAIIKDQIKKEFIEEVMPTDEPGKRVHYIPHHAVNKESSTTPIRIVYDCSCRMSRNHPSLNDCLQSTPPQLNDLTAILVRFRFHKFAVVSDIEKAFLHVGLHEKDRDVTRFLWPSDPTNPDSPLKTYRFKSVLFGSVCSPFILNATILKHLQRNCDNWISEKLCKDLYVDNFLSSFDKEADVLRNFRESRDLMSAAGFKLRSWNSNSILLREMTTHHNVLDEDKVTKLLGLRWQPEMDIMTFAERPIDTNPITTKRYILQSTSRIYDPLGILSQLP
ncbi:uncharacterized protein LOC123525818 [Mercenaria mercenaria]|uniref:uncharacterized protein LOC123525818 n=1 Tax=Mercenaria mercenaria TaxID=6596 RepID=UPI00234F66B5|nr:uncharacterized protein LOC123525818 [Mercenaria mercenaria]